MNVVFVGHVDHGKSTTIGRLCYDTGTLPPDKVAEIERISRELGRPTEFAFVMDHLEEERTGGLTIDTAQVFFKSANRHYVIIDAPGHREFLKNMITGASQAEAALLIIDAAEGMREQSRRHAFLLSMLNVRRVIVVLNKMDLVGYKESRFEAVKREMLSFLGALKLAPAEVVPISAARGDNVVMRSEHMPWYTGPTALEALDALPKRAAAVDRPMRLPVQNVFTIDGRQIAVGRVEAGLIRQGDTVALLPGVRSAEVLSVEEFGRLRTQAEAGESIGVVLAGGDGARRGNVISDRDALPLTGARFLCSLFWMNERALSKGDQLTLRLATQERSCRVSRILERINSSTLEVLEEDADVLHHSEVGKALIEVEQPVVLELFETMAELGRFVLEREHDVVAAGTVSEVQ